MSRRDWIPDCETRCGGTPDDEPQEPSRVNVRDLLETIDGRLDWYIGFNGDNGGILHSIRDLIADALERDTADGLET